MYLSKMAMAMSPLELQCGIMQYSTLMMHMLECRNLCLALQVADQGHRYLTIFIKVMGLAFGQLSR